MITSVSILRASGFWKAVLFAIDRRHVLRLNINALVKRLKLDGNIVNIIHHHITGLYVMRQTRENQTQADESADMLAPILL